MFLPLPLASRTVNLGITTYRHILNVCIVGINCTGLIKPKNRCKCAVLHNHALHLVIGHRQACRQTKHTAKLVSEPLPTITVTDLSMPALGRGLAADRNFIVVRSTEYGTP